MQNTGDLFISCLKDTFNTGELKLRVLTKATTLILFSARDDKMFRNISLTRKMIVDLSTTLGLL